MLARLPAPSRPQHGDARILGRVGRHDLGRAIAGIIVTYQQMPAGFGLSKQAVELLAQEGAAITDRQQDINRFFHNAQEAVKGLPTVVRKGPSLHRGAVDSPAVVSVSGTTFTTTGWAHDRLGIREIRVRSEGRVVARTRPNLARPDVAAALRKCAGIARPC